MQELLELAVSAALEAGKAVMEVYESGDFGTVTKADDSPLTIADTKAHDIIFEKLTNSGILILSEEGKDIPYHERESCEQLWVVDPIDGTKEFIKRNGDFTVNIALVKNHVPVLGVIFVPVHNQLYYSLEGSGAFRATVETGTLPTLASISPQAERLPLPASKTKNYSVVGSKSHMNDDTYNYIASLEKTHGKIDLVSRGSSLKLCMVAEGSADLYPRFAPTMEWDTAAGTAIVLAAGGSVIDYSTNKPLLYNRKNLLNPWFIAKR